MIRITDLNVALLSQALLAPGEQLVARGAAHHQPWWSFGIPLFKKTYLILASQARLLLIEHRLGILPPVPRLQNVHVVPMANIETLRLKGLFTKKLVFKALTESTMIGGQPTTPGTLLKGTFKVPGFFGPVKENVRNLERIVTTWQSARALPGGYGQRPSFAPALPAPSVSGYPQAPVPQGQHPQGQYAQQQGVSGYPQAAGYPQPQSANGYPAAQPQAQLAPGQGQAWPYPRTGNA